MPSKPPGRGLILSWALPLPVLGQGLRLADHERLDDVGADLPTLTYTEVSELHERKAIRSPSRLLASSRACVTLSVFLLVE